CWYRDSQYCGRCGTKAEHDGKERMMRCPTCGNMMFPRIMPSVIVAVVNGDSLLLTRYNRPGAKRTALVAGFTEFGETVEDTVRREVMEEASLKVKNLRYYKSQPWGISGGGLLFGFWCEVDGDDTIRIDGVELADAAWVSREELQRDFVDTGIALTGEMIRVFSEGGEK
ncbi:MAG: NUDIX domain-containing protein, partial [Oscillospiraceae bacterium]|nr:NUDIX domain-containing protein [Oscillospiraceae bacterium]